MPDNPNYISKRELFIKMTARAGRDPVARQRLSLFTALDTASRSSSPIGFLADWFAHANRLPIDQWTALTEVIKADLSKLTSMTLKRKEKD